MWQHSQIAATHHAPVTLHLASLEGTTDEQLKGALGTANLPVLLALIEQFRGGAAGVTDGVLPAVGDTAGERPLTDEMRSAIRDQAFEVLRDVRDGTCVLPETIDAVRFSKMATFCLGTDLEDEFVPMVLEDMGFSDSALTRVCWSNKSPPLARSEFLAVIVGAGLSGICAAIHLERLGIPYRLLEKNADLGGTWYENCYPACGVDTPNHFYSYSFAPNDSWTTYYSKRDELLAYLKQTAERHGVAGNAEFGTEVLGAQYDEPGQRWHVRARARDGVVEEIECNLLISGVGQVNRASIPDIPGSDRFHGPQFHSSHWRHDANLLGKRVAVIGTGASAMQFAPAIAPDVSNLTIFQRTPHWIRILPEYHEQVSDGERWLLAHVPFYRNWYRLRLYWSYGDALLETLRVDPEWADCPYAINALNDRFRQSYVRNLKRALGDRKDLIDKVVPDYPLFAKRMLIDNHWCEMLQRDNVDLVSGSVAEIRKDSLVGSDGVSHRADVIIYATGFKALHFLWPMKIFGRGDVSLADQWGDDARAYLGMAAPDFPNLFILYGPNTNIAHGGSIFFHAECQARYIAKCAVHMIENGIGEIEVTDKAHREYCDAVDTEHDRLIWRNSSVGEWFKNDRGKVIGITPWRLVDYWHMTYEPRWRDFRFQLRTERVVGGEVLS